MFKKNAKWSGLDKVTPGWSRKWTYAPHDIYWNRKTQLARKSYDITCSSFILAFLFYFICILLILFLLFLNLSNKLFLGDGGIFLLGIIISISLIFEHNIQKNILYADEIFLLLLLPGIDLIRLTIIRIYNRRNPFFGDRNHIQHLLTSKFSLFYANFILLIVSLIPILLFSWVQLNFYIVLCSFLTIYFFLILTLRFYD